MNKKFLLVIFIPLIAFGLGSKTFNWTPPDSRENGDPMTIQEIDRFPISCGTQAGGPYDAFTFNAAGNVSSFVAADIFPEGTYFCVAQTVDTNGEISRYSNEVNFTVGRCQATDCRPRPPVLNVSP